MVTFSYAPNGSLADRERGWEATVDIWSKTMIHGNCRYHWVELFPSRTSIGTVLSSKFRFFLGWTIHFKVDTFWFFYVSVRQDECRLSRLCDRCWKKRTWSFRQTQMCNRHARRAHPSAINTAPALRELFAAHCHHWLHVRAAIIPRCLWKGTNNRLDFCYWACIWERSDESVHTHTHAGSDFCLSSVLQSRKLGWKKASGGNRQDKGDTWVIEQYKVYANQVSPYC